MAIAPDPTREQLEDYRLEWEQVRWRNLGRLLAAAGWRAIAALAVLGVAVLVGGVTAWNGEWPMVLGSAVVGAIALAVAMSSVSFHSHATLYVAAVSALRAKVTAQATRITTLDEEVRDLTTPRLHVVPKVVRTPGSNGAAWLLMELETGRAPA